MNQETTWAAPSRRELSDRIDRLRFRGRRGSFIPRHRSMLASSGGFSKLAGAVALVLVFWVLLFLGRGAVAESWRWCFEFWRQVLDMPGATVLAGYELGGVHFELPYLHFGAGLPGNVHWWIGAVGAALLLVASLVLPERYLPLAYMLRIVAFFQTTAQVYFAFWSEHFPYSGEGYVHGMVIACFFLLAMIPAILGFTYYLFDFSLRRRVGLTLLMTGHLAVMVPLQYMLHAWLIHHYTLLFLPLLFFVAGLPLNVMVFIAMFGWGFSWQDRLHDEDVQRRALRLNRKRRP